jgi:multiple sugar transport system ATP-binding protein
MNLCRSRCSGNGSVSLGGVDVALPNGARAQRGGDVIVGLRPEALELAADGIPAGVEVVEEIGADAYVFAAAELNGEVTKLVARVEAKRAPGRGDRVMLRPRAGEAHLFDLETGARLDD